KPQTAGATAKADYRPSTGRYRAHRWAGLLLLCSLCLMATLFAPVFADAEEGTAASLSTGLPALSVPVLSVHGETVEWSALLLESSYKVAISNDARGTADRTTRYLSIARTPGEVQSYTPTLNPGETAYIGVSADGGLTWSEEATVTAPPEPTAPSVPVLSVHGETVEWSALLLESSYKVAISNDARGTADRTTRYLSIARTPGEVQSYTPTLNPGETAYIGVSADGGLTWSEEATVTAPPEPEPTTPPAPVLSVNGYTLSWAAVPGARSYELATILNPTTTRETTYQVVTGTSITVPPVPGKLVNYGLAVNFSTGQGPWAPEVSISYPSVPVTEPPAVPGGSKIVGTNDGAGWGPAAAKTILEGHITWNRVEIGMSSNTLSQSLSDGFHVLAIVGNVSDSTPLSQIEPSAWAASVVSELQTNPGIEIAEAGNEM